MSQLDNSFIYLSEIFLNSAYFERKQARQGHKNARVFIQFTRYYLTMVLIPHSCKECIDLTKAVLLPPLARFHMEKKIISCRLLPWPGNFHNRRWTEQSLPLFSFHHPSFSIFYLEDTSYVRYTPSYWFQSKEMCETILHPT